MADPNRGHLAPARPAGAAAAAAARPGRRGRRQVRFSLYSEADADYDPNVGILGPLQNPERENPEVDPYFAHAYERGEDFVFSDDEDVPEDAYGPMYPDADDEGNIIPGVFVLGPLTDHVRNSCTNEATGDVCGRPPQYWAKLVQDYGTKAVWDLMKKEVAAQGYTHQGIRVALETGIREYRASYGIDPIPLTYLGEQLKMKRDAEEKAKEDAARGLPPPPVTDITKTPMGGFGTTYSTDKTPEESAAVKNSHAFSQELFLTYARDSKNNPIISADMTKGDPSFHLPVASGTERGLINVLQTLNSASQNAVDWTSFMENLKLATNPDKQQKLLADIRESEMALDRRHNKIIIPPMPELRPPTDMTRDANVVEARAIRDFNHIIGSKFGHNNKTNPEEAKEFLREFKNYVDGRYTQNAAYTLLKASTENDPRQMVIEFSSQDQPFSQFWDVFCRWHTRVPDSAAATRELIALRDKYPDDVQAHLRKAINLAIKAALSTPGSKGAKRHRATDLFLEEATLFLEKWYPHLIDDLMLKYERLSQTWTAERARLRQQGLEPDLYYKGPFDPIWTLYKLIVDAIHHRPKSLINRPYPASQQKAIDYEPTKKRRGFSNPLEACAPNPSFEVNYVHSYHDDVPAPDELYEQSPGSGEYGSASTLGFWERESVVVDTVQQHASDVASEVGSGDSASQIGMSQVALSHLDPHDVHALHDKPGQVSQQRFVPPPGGPPPRRPDGGPRRQDRRDHDDKGGAKPRMNQKKDRAAHRFCRNCGSLNHDWDWCPYYKDYPPTKTQCPNCKYFHAGSCKLKAIQEAKMKKEESDRKRRGN